MIEAKIIPFRMAPEYVNEGGRNQLCRDFWNEGEIGHVVVGHNVMQGNGRNGSNRHDRWNQIFVATKGQGTMIMDGEMFPVEAPCVIVIPAGVEHDLLTAADQQIEYVYVNDFVDD